MEAKLRAKHDEELHNLKQQQEAHAEFSATVHKSWNDYKVGDERRRLLEEKQSCLDEAAVLRAEMVANERRCVYFLTV
jgi:hypothetical protein